MPVKLSVISYKGLPLPKELTAEFNQLGGTIGRKSGNTLVLADAENFVSGHHADVLFENGQYFIRDGSKNGTYLVNAGINLNAAQAQLLNREILRIGEYEISVEVVNELSELAFSGFQSTDSPLFFDPFVNSSDSVLNQPMHSSQPIEVTGPHIGEGLQDRDPFHDSFMSPNVQANVTEPPKDIADLLKGLDSLTSISNESVPPQLNSTALGGDGGSKIPLPSLNDLDFDELFSKKSEGLPLGQTVDLQSVDGLTRDSSADLVKLHEVNNSAKLVQMFFEGAGLADQTFSEEEHWPEIMKATGVLFRTLVEGLMDVLRARAEMKSEFRVSVTTIRSFENNPLKFNPDVDSVLRLMLGKNNPAFLNSVEAVSEAFRDIKYHQLAMTAGVQAAVVSILNSFEPESFEKLLGEGILFQKKAKCWELYCERYPELKSRALEDFFGEEFAEAYDKQMRLFARR